MKKILSLNILGFTLLVAALTFITSCQNKGPETGIGLQLYSLRQDMKKDPVTTIEKVGTIGYDFVESANYNNGKIYDMDPAEFTALVEKNGMIYMGAHVVKNIPDSVNWKDLMPWWDECIAAHKKAGVKYIVQPSMGKSAYTSLKVLQDYCEYFNAIGEKCAAVGIKFGYHNHDKEFSELEKQVIYDYMLQHTNPEKVFFQMDIYWIIEGGKEPAEYFKEYPGRFKSIHIKDEKELGESGKIDLKPILDMAGIQGAKYYVVEVEKYNFEPIVSVQKSLQYLKEIEFVK